MYSYLYYGYLGYSVYQNVQVVSYVLYTGKLAVDTLRWLTPRKKHITELNPISDWILIDID